MTTPKIHGEDFTVNRERRDCPAEDGHPDSPFICTLDAGHDGPHVAGTGAEIVGVWEDGHTVTLAWSPSEAEVAEGIRAAQKRREVT